jgi:basic membrane lipoprotein Med (substrate-binding protein (PBP1-ABC) superfamily)
MVIYRLANVTLTSAFPITPLAISYNLVFIIHFRFKMSLQNVMSKREKLGLQIIDHFFTKPYHVRIYQMTLINNVL